MAKAYSIDLRRAVISFIESGGSKRDASKLFGVGESAIYSWLRRQKMGDLGAKKRTDFPRKIDPEALQEYVSKNPDHTLIEIAAALNLGRQTIFRWLRRLKMTRKKRPSSTKSVALKNAPNFKRN